MIHRWRDDTCKNSCLSPFHGWILIEREVASHDGLIAIRASIKFGGKGKETRYKYPRACYGISFLLPPQIERMTLLIFGARHVYTDAKRLFIMKRRGRAFALRKKTGSGGLARFFGSCHPWYTHAFRYPSPSTEPINFYSLRTGSANCGGRRRTRASSFLALPFFLVHVLFFSALVFAQDLEVDVRLLVRERH